METGRLEAFSDGVFAVAITLLVLTLSVPPNGAVMSGLADEWPEFAAFALSFVIIGVVWVNHHAVIRRLARADRVLLFVNLGLLMSVVLIPFTTALFARYLTRGGTDSHIAGALFSGALLLMGLGFIGLQTWAARHPHLLKPGPPIDMSLRSFLRFGLGGICYAVCIGLSFVSAQLVLVIIGLLAAYYVVDQFTGDEPLHERPPR
jgi:uncharacterized membrane protein